MNTIYPTAKQKFAEAEIAWSTGTIVAVLLDTSIYTYSGAHSSLADIPTNARVAWGTLTGKTTLTGGVVDANDVSFGSVTGPVSRAVALVQDSGTDSSTDLVCYVDTANGLPVTPTGGIINVFWDNGTNRIFAL